MKHKNLFLIGLLSLMLAFSFTACGGSGDNGSIDTGNSTVEGSVGESDNTPDDSSSNDNSSDNSSNDDSSNDSSSGGDSSSDLSNDDSSNDSSSGDDSSNDSSSGDDSSDGSSGGDSSSDNSSSGDDSSDVQTKTWTVSFDCGAWTTLSDVVVEDGETIVAPTLPESPDYQFIKWTLNGETFDFSTPITGDITLVLVYGTYGDIV